MSLWSAGLFGGAIPDSEADQKLVHRWITNEGSGTSLSDSAGSQTATVSGATWVSSNDWVGGAVLDGDGQDDDVTAGELTNFEGATLDDCAIAFSIETTDTGTPYLYGAENVDGALVRAALGESAASTGELWIGFEDDGDNNRARVYTENTRIDGGSKYRVVINKTGQSASDISVYLNQSSVSVTVEQGDTVSLPAWNGQEWSWFCTNNNNSPRNFANAKIDDFCLFESSLTATEAQSYNNPWS
jgi:hypothetical protein